MSFPCVHPQHDAHQSISLKNNVESWLMVRCWGFNRPKEEQIACMDHSSRTLPPRTPLVFNALMKTSTLWIFCKKQQQKKLKTEQVCLVLRADWDYSAVEIVDKYLKTISFILQLHSNSHFFFNVEHSPAIWRWQEHEGLLKASNLEWKAPQRACVNQISKATFTACNSNYEDSRKVELYEKKKLFEQLEAR